MNQNNQDQTADTQYVIEPYTGVGSGVLQHGTIVELAPGEEYANGDQIVGKLNDPAKYPGTWVIRKEQ